MTARVLPQDEWPRLAGTELESVWPVLESSARIVVVERDGAIVGCHAIWLAWHLDGLWKAPDAGAGVGRLLWATVQQTASAMGVRSVITTAADARVRRLLEHPKVGAIEIPGTNYAVPVRG